MSRPNYIVPLVIAFAFFMEQIDGSVIATALPRIAESLNTDPIHLNLAITAYMFSLAVFIPLSGWIADRFGARNVFRLAIAVFTIGSIACGLSANLSQLVMARILQGAGGAMMVPVGRLVLLRTIPKAQLVDAIALMTAPALTGPVLGPPIGGIIVTYASWRWIFFINVPLGVLGIILASRYFKDIKGRKQEPLDFKGFVLMALSLTGLMFGLETIGRDIVSAPIIAGALGAGAIALIAYVRHMRRTKYPIVDLRPLSYATYRIAITGGSFFRIAIGAMPFLLPLMLQYGYGLTPAMSGFVTLASAAGACLMKTVAKPVIRWAGFRSLLVVNAVINALFFFGFALFDAHTSMAFIFTYLLVGSLFRSLQFTALNSVAYADIPEHLINRANTFYSTVQQLCFAMGVAAGAFVLNVTLHLHGTTQLRIADFQPAFLILSGLTLLSSAFYLFMARDAGDIMRGRQEAETLRKDPV